MNEQSDFLKFFEKDNKNTSEKTYNYDCYEFNFTGEISAISYDYYGGRIACCGVDQTIQVS